MGSAPRETKLALISNELPPYRRPVFERLGQRSGIRLKALLCTPREAHRIWSPPHSTHHTAIDFVRNITFNRKVRGPDTAHQRTRRIHIPYGLPVALARWRPDVVISGGFGAPSLLASIYSRITGCKFLLWSEEIAYVAQGTTRLQRALRRYLVRTADGTLAWGRKAESYLRSIGSGADSTFFCPQAVDNDYFVDAAAQVDRSAVAAQYKLRPHVALFVGQLGEPRKGLSELLEAWAALPSPLQQSSSLLVVGPGELTPKARDRLSRMSTSHVVITGPVGPPQLARFYAASDFLVFPSFVDVWGLVVNEAMASGLPVLCSTLAGASELVLDGRTGTLVDPRDPLTLTRALSTWLSRDTRAMQAEIQSHISNWSFSACERAVYEALVAVCGIAPRTPHSPEAQPEATSQRDSSRQESTA